jgi:hypothetical protein
MTSSPFIVMMRAFVNATVPDGFARGIVSRTVVESIGAPESVD